MGGEPGRDGVEFAQDDGRGDLVAFERAGRLRRKARGRTTYVFLCPCLDKLLKLAWAVVPPPGFGEGWEVLEAKIVEVGDKPLGVSDWPVLVIGVVELDFEPGCVHWLRS